LQAGQNKGSFHTFHEADSTHKLEQCWDAAAGDYGDFWPQKFVKSPALFAGAAGTACQGDRAFEVTISFGSNSCIDRIAFPQCSPIN